MNIKTLVNNIIIEQVLLEKNKQSGQRFASLIDWTVVLNLRVFFKSPLLISNLLLKNTRVYIKDFGILKAGLHKIIKLVKKDKSEPKLDLIERDQPLS